MFRANESLHLRRLLRVVEHGTSLLNKDGDTDDGTAAAAPAAAAAAQGGGAGAAVTRAAVEPSLATAAAAAVAAADGGDQPSRPPRRPPGGVVAAIKLGRILGGAAVVPPAEGIRTGGRVGRQVCEIRNVMPMPSFFVALDFLPLCVPQMMFLLDESQWYIYAYTLCPAREKAVFQGARRLYAHEPSPTPSQTVCRRQQVQSPRFPFCCCLIRSFRFVCRRWVAMPRASASAFFSSPIVQHDQ